jgi:CPA2 family monovalent cation:H+ antiporter-2/glutathione-regulated potassium-efflux system protein KefB
MLATLVCLLAAAVVFVLISRRLGFGSILGYLVAGAVIGPSGLRLVRDVGQISEISELGVLMLLFLIGLELRIQRLWLMRKTVFGLGAAQMILAGSALTGLAHLAGAPWAAAAIIGAGLALSSTAIVLPMLADRELLASGAGRDAFAVLLFQDLASIPLVALIPLFGIQAAAGGSPPLIGFLRAVAAMAVIVLGGRFLVRPLFRALGGARTPEVFTATALLVVAGAAALASVAGLPMSLGAFAAGVVLSESEYRHELQVDIEPFEGLLLGFFFISVGMSANTALALAEPGVIVLGVAALLAVKIAVGFGLARAKRHSIPTSVRFALALPQGSEFAFVLFGAALAAGALAKPQVDRAMLVVALSMFASPILFALSERFLIPRLLARRAWPFDSLDDAKPAPVVICGFGRVGQIVGRVLLGRQIPFNALDPDAENVDTVRRYGHKAYFGDPTRLDLLRAVGAGEAKVLVAALGDIEQNMKLVETVRRNFPDLTIYARARNRRHAHLLMDAGVEHIVRETFFSSLRLTELVLGGVGLSPEDARRTVQRFREHDEHALIEQHGIHTDEKQMIQTAAEAAEELRRLFEADRTR